MKFTRYVNQYIDLNGHNFIGVHEIHQDRALLHYGCEHHNAMVVVQDGERSSPFVDVDTVVFGLDIGHDDEGVAYCTIDIESPYLPDMRRMEEREEGQRLQ